MRPCALGQSVRAQQLHDGYVSVTAAPRCTSRPVESVQFLLFRDLANMAAAQAVHDEETGHAAAATAQATQYDTGEPVNEVRAAERRCGYFLSRVEAPTRRTVTSHRPPPQPPRPTLPHSRR